MTEQDQRQLVLQEAISWCGTPFHENSFVKGVGVDCGRFLCACFAAGGIKVPDPKDISIFPVQWHLHKNDERYLHLITQFTKITNNPLPGDIIMFRIGRGFAHSGILLETSNLMIHSAPPCVSKANINQLPRLRKHERLFLTPWGI